MENNSNSTKTEVIESESSIPHKQGGSLKVWVGKLQEIVDHSGFEISSEDRIYIGYNEPEEGDAYVSGEIYVGEEKPSNTENKRWYTASEKGGGGQITIPIKWMRDIVPENVSVDDIPVKVWLGNSLIVMEPVNHITYTSKLNTHNDRRVTITEPMQDIIGDHEEPTYYIEFSSSINIDECIVGNVAAEGDADTEYNLSRKVGYSKLGKHYVTIPVNLYDLIDWSAPEGIDPYITISAEENGLIFCTPDRQTIKHPAHQMS